MQAVDARLRVCVLPTGKYVYVNEALIHSAAFVDYLKWYQAKPLPYLLNIKWK